MPWSKVKPAMLFAIVPFIAAPAAAFDGASIQIGGRVPTLCEVRMSAMPGDVIHAGTNELGTMTEMCNSASGYTVTLNHPAGLVDAWVEVGSTRIPISANSTQTVIVDNRLPAFQERALRLVLAGQAEALSDFSLDAQPKGEIF